MRFGNLLFGIGLACKRKLLRKFFHCNLARFHIGLEARNLFFEFCCGSLQTIQFAALFRNILFEECLAFFALFFLGYSLSQRCHLVAVFGIFRIAALAGVFQTALAKEFMHQRIDTSLLFFVGALRLRSFCTLDTAYRFRLGSQILELFQFGLARRLHRFTSLMRMIRRTTNRARFVFHQSFGNDSRLFVQERAIHRLVFRFLLLIIRIGLDIDLFRLFKGITEAGQFFDALAHLQQVILPCRKFVQLRNQFLLLGTRIA